MQAATKFPLTLMERLELGPDEVRFPASFEEFKELIEVCDYQIEYQNGEIILMSIATDPHEQIVANLITIFGTIFKGQSLYKRYGSNRHVFIPEFNAAYSPDASIVMGAQEIFEYAKDKTANLNPWLVTEVLSESTHSKDWGEKLPRYKKTASMRYIIYVEQDFPLVTVFQRADNVSRWSAEDYDALNQSFELGGKSVSVADIYENVIL